MGAKLSEDTLGKELFLVQALNPKSGECENHEYFDLLVDAVKLSIELEKESIPYRIAEFKVLSQSEIKF